jgi:hypothetical protein
MASVGEGSNTKTIVIPIFDGDTEDIEAFEIYIFQLTIAACLKFNAVSMRKFFDTKVDDYEIQAEDNVNAYLLLAASCKGKALRIIRGVKFGEGRLALKALLHEFTKQNPIYLPQLLKGFLNVSYVDPQQLRHEFLKFLKALEDVDIGKHKHGSFPLPMLRAMVLNILPAEFDQLYRDQVKLVD